MKSAFAGLEPSILRVDKYYRIALPQTLSQRVGWITGDRSLQAWLLMGGSGRLRLLSDAEAEHNHDIQVLRAKIAELTVPANSVLEFQEEALVALPLRLASVQITPPEPGWRLSLPKPVAAVMQIRPGDSDVAALFIQDHIELWTIETLRAALNTPLIQIM